MLISTLLVSKVIVIFSENLNFTLKRSGEEVSNMYSLMSQKDPRCFCLQRTKGLGRQYVNNFDRNKVF